LNYLRHKVWNTTSYTGEEEVKKMMSYMLLKNLKSLTLILFGYF